MTFETRRQIGSSASTYNAGTLLLSVICVGMTAWNAYKLTINFGGTPVTLDSQLLACSIGHPETDDVWKDGCTCSLSPRMLMRRVKQRTDAMQKTAAYGEWSPFAANSSSQYEDTPRAHLGSKYFEKSPPGTREIKRWMPGGKLGSYITGNVSHADGRLTVPASGYYHVYSKVDFILAWEDRQPGQPMVNHEILRKVVNGTRVDTLARSQKTHCWDRKNKFSMESSYLGAVFHLNKGDQVFVKITDVNFIWQSSRRTYFGVSMISP